MGADCAVSILVKTYWSHLTGIKEGVVGREGGGGRIGGRRRREAATVTSQPAAKKAR